MKKRLFLLSSFCFISLLLISQPAERIDDNLPANDKLNALIDSKAAEIEAQVIQWRRHIHQNPELSNREFKTAEMVAEHLKSLNIEVQTGIAITGVKGVLKGGKPGPVVALRADMDALPVKERVDIPFASKAKGEYRGAEVDVMHACGHDTHVAMLMGAASVLASIKDENTWHHCIYVSTSRRRGSSWRRRWCRCHDRGRCTFKPIGRCGFWNSHKFPNRNK